MSGFVRLESSVAVITGAGSGIGRASALALAGRGSRVVVSDVDAGRAEAVAAEIEAAGGRCRPLRCDVTEPDAFERLREQALEGFGQVDVIMNNVGVIAMGPPESLPLSEWQRVVDINLLSVVRSSLAFLPLLLEQGKGHLVNTASVSGLLAHGFDRLPYVTTKHALVGMSESLAMYLRPHGIGVTCLCPSGVVTNIVEQITFFGKPKTPRSPYHPVVDAQVVGELVADAVEDGHFLVLTAPDEVHDELLERARDIETYLERSSQALGRP